MAKHFYYAVPLVQRDRDVALIRAEKSFIMAPHPQACENQVLQHLPRLGCKRREENSF